MSADTPSIGIIGGFGPDTSAEFCVRIVQHAHIITQLYPPSFVIDFVSVPPKLSGEAIKGSREAGATLVSAINESITRLHTIGVTTIALPCNTMHLFADQFAIPSSVHFLHIADAVLHELQKRQIRRIGLLATQLTVSSRLYADRCSAVGIECISPSLSLQSQLSEDIGHFVQTGEISIGTAHMFKKIFEEFSQANVTTVVFGCTDLSGMVNRCRFALPMQSVDSMDVLAKACARLSVSE